MTMSLAFLAPDLVKPPSMGVCRTALESRAFLTCLPNGAGNVEFSDLARIGLHSNRVSATAVRRRPETKAQKWPRQSNVVSPETETNQRAPLIGSSRISK